jgi:hypothetical protein
MEASCTQSVFSDQAMIIVNFNHSCKIKIYDRKKVLLDMATVRNLEWQWMNEKNGRVAGE